MIHILLFPGVKIGIKSIMGVGSIVTKDVDSYSVVADVSIKFIKYGFEEKISQELLDLN